MFSPYRIKRGSIYAHVNDLKETGLGGVFFQRKFQKKLEHAFGPGNRVPSELKMYLSPIYEMAERHMVEFSLSKENSTQWEINVKEHTFTVPNGIKFTLDSLDPMIFSETFVYDIHFIDFNLENKVILDAGGFVGDTALYYAQKGAIVYTFEPDPNNFQKMLKNLELNKEISKRIHPLNAAIGFDGWLDFPAGDGGGSSIFNRNFHTINVRSHSVGQFLKENNIEDPFLLHLDIKGAEDIVLEDPALRRFQRIRLEYSPYLNSKMAEFGDYPAWLKGHFEKIGFKNIRTFKHNNFRQPLRFHGTVDAIKS